MAGEAVLGEEGVGGEGDGEGWGWDKVGGETLADEVVLEVAGWVRHLLKVVELLNKM